MSSERTDVICDRIVDDGVLLSKVGQMDLPHATGRGDGARHGGSTDSGRAGLEPETAQRLSSPFDGGADPEEVVRIKTRDFR